MADLGTVRQLAPSPVTIGSDRAVAVTCNVGGSAAEDRRKAMLPRDIDTGAAPARTLAPAIPDI